MNVYPEKHSFENDCLPDNLKLHSICFVKAGPVPEDKQKKTKTVLL
jgi:hypothetical protein